MTGLTCSGDLLSISAVHVEYSSTNLILGDILDVPLGGCTPIHILKYIRSSSGGSSLLSFLGILAKNSVNTHILRNPIAKQILDNWKNLDPHRIWENQHFKSKDMRSMISLKV